MAQLLVIGGGLVALLAVAYLVGWIIESIVTGALFQPARRQALQRRQVAREAQVISNGIRIKWLLDSEAFAAHKEMLRVAQEIANRR